MDKLRHTPSIGQIILAILREVGTGTIKSFFPHPYSHLFCNHRDKRSFRSATKRLRDANLIVKNGDIFKLTKEGQKEAFWAYLNAEVSSYQLLGEEKPKWDGKWRIIFFDIPEKKRGHRDFLRSVIRATGFKEFQKSAWIYPYKIPDFLVQILEEENILPYTRFVTTAHLDYDDDFKKLFSL